MKRPKIIDADYTVVSGAQPLRRKRINWLWLALIAALSLGSALSHTSTSEQPAHNSASE